MESIPLLSPYETGTFRFSHRLVGQLIYQSFSKLDAFICVIINLFPFFCSNFLMPQPANSSLLYEDNLKFDFLKFIKEFLSTYL
jgi:hypothetical protein